jgi:hypothetical protein
MVCSFSDGDDLKIGRAICLKAEADAVLTARS